MYRLWLRQPGLVGPEEMELRRQWIKSQGTQKDGRQEDHHDRATTSALRRSKTPTVDRRIPSVVRAQEALNEGNFVAVPPVGP
jgi:hypothetical protein